MRRAAAALLCLLAAAAGGAELASSLPGPDELSPLARVGEVERHSPDSLWEKINGEAELYRRFGLRAAAFAYFEHPREPARGLEVSAFQLADALGAFGVWATFRPSSAMVEPLGNGGFRDGYQAALWHGNTFLLLHAFGDEGQRAAALEAGLAAVTRKLGAAPPRPALLQAFEGLVNPATVRYAPDHLLGRATLPPGLEGETREGQRVFVSTGSEGGAQALASYREFLAGGSPVSVGGAEGWTGVDANLGPVTVVSRGGVLAGVRGPADAPGVERTLAALLDRPRP